MTRLIAKFLLVVAVVLMPFGMASARASADQHHSMSASMPVQHCPEQGSKHDMTGGFADCAMACSAALPAADSLQENQLLIARQDILPAAVRSLRGLHPETATPPPKRS